MINDNTKLNTRMRVPETAMYIETVKCIEFVDTNTMYSSLNGGGGLDDFFIFRLFKSILFSVN